MSDVIESAHVPVSRFYCYFLARPADLNWPRPPINSERWIFPRRLPTIRKARVSVKSYVPFSLFPFSLFGECAVEDLWRGRLCVELDLLEAIEGQLLVMEKKLDELGEADPQVQRLQSIKGVGPRLAETVVACLDDPHRFKNANQVGSYAGLVPKQLESGEMKRVGRITRRGSTLLRGMLVEVAWMVHRHNAWAKAFVLKVSRGMKSRKRIAIVALARKLLVKMWAMLRDGTDWSQPGCGEGGGKRRNQREDLAALGQVSGSPPEDTGRVMALSSVVGAPAV